MAISKDDSAFPYFQLETGDEETTLALIECGLTKREWMAAIALQGLLANDKWEYKLAAENAVALADALIAELNK